MDVEDGWQVGEIAKFGMYEMDLCCIIMGLPMVFTGEK